MCKILGDRLQDEPPNTKIVVCVVRNIYWLHSLRKHIPSCKPRMPLLPFLCLHMLQECYYAVTFILLHKKKKQQGHVNILYVWHLQGKQNDNS